MIDTRTPAEREKDNRIDRLTRCVKEIQETLDKSQETCSALWNVAHERDIALAKVQKLTEALEWYVEHDETNDATGDRWRIEGLKRALEALGRTNSGQNHHPR